MAFEQGPGQQDHARGAIAALECSLVDKRLLHRVQLPVLRQAFDSLHRTPVELEGKHRTGGCGHSINQRHAGTAHAARTPDPGAGQPQIVAQQVGRGAFNRHRHAARGTVELQTHLVFG